MTETNKSQVPASRVRGIENQNQANPVQDIYDWVGTLQQWNNGATVDWYSWRSNALGWNVYTMDCTEQPKYCAYSGSTYVIAGSKECFYSNNGSTWTRVENDLDCCALVYGYDKFLAISEDGEYTYSTTGNSWLTGSLPAGFTSKALCYGNGKYVSVGYGSNKAVYSLNGTSWLESTLPLSATWSTITYGNGKYVAIAKGTNKVVYSTDAITWSDTTVPTSDNWSSVCYGGNKFIAVATNSNKFTSSTDGITWTESTLPQTADWTKVYYGANKFIVVGKNSNKYLYSQDGVVWGYDTIQSKPWTDLCYGNNKFLLTSEDKSYASAIGTGKECYTRTTEPVSTTKVYSAPNTESSLVIIQSGTTSIKLSDNITYNRATAGDKQTQTSIGLAHPDWICYITDDLQGGSTVYTKEEVDTFLEGKQDIIGYVPADDNNTVHKTGNETITGDKTFTGVVEKDFGTGAGRLYQFRIGLNSYEVPEAHVQYFLSEITKDGRANNYIEFVHTNDGKSGINLNASIWDGDTRKTSTLGIAVDKTGAAYSQAPTPAVTDNSNKIATTNWCKSTGNGLVHTSGDETIAGSKIFTGTSSFLGGMNLGDSTSHVGKIELYGGNQNYGGYFDFHYKDSAADFTSRIIEDGNGYLKINGAGFPLNASGAKLYAAPNEDTTSSVQIDTVGARNTKINSIDSTAVHKTGTETVSGNKTFSGTNTFSGSNTFNNEVFITNNTTNSNVLSFKDTGLDTTVAPTALHGRRFALVDKNGTNVSEVNLLRDTNNSRTTIRTINGICNKEAVLAVRVDDDGTQYATAPTPAVSDNSTKITTTAYINSKFQVVSALPSSPNANVFYFVKG